MAPRRSMCQRIEAELGNSAHISQIRSTNSIPITSMGAPIGFNPIQNPSDEPPSRRQCTCTSPRYDCFDQTMIISSPSTVERSGSSFPHPFDFNSPYESESDEAAFLACAMAQWSGVSEKVPTQWHGDPRSGIAQAQQNLRMVSYEMLMSCQKLSDEVEYHKQKHAKLREEMKLFRQNYVPRREFDRVSTLYAEASTKLANSQESLATLQSQYDASINELKKKLSIVDTELREARTKLSDAKYLAESFKQTEAVRWRMIAFNMESRWLWALLKQNILTLTIALFNPKLMLGEMTKIKVSIAWVFLRANLCQLSLNMTSQTSLTHSSMVSLTFLTQEPWQNLVILGA